jgi:hypothetical protein
MHVGGNPAIETVQGYMVAYKNGGQEDDDLDDDIIPLSIPEHRLDAMYHSNPVSSYSLI